MKIAIIEDSKTLASIIGTCLKSNGYSHILYSATDIGSGKVFEQKYNLLILNTLLRNISVERFIERIRKQNDELYIVGVCSKGDWKSKVNVLNAGADDVLSYPFPMQELIARIEAISRRPRKAILPQVLKAKDIVVNPIQRRVEYKDLILPIRNKEYTLFEYLLRNKNRPVTRVELIGTVWEYRNTSRSNTIDVHISKLRSLLPNPEIIETVHGVGYKLCDASANDTGFTHSDGSDKEDEIEFEDLAPEYIEDSIFRDTDEM